MSSTMQVNGVQARIMSAEALTGDNVHSLPPGNACIAHVVDEYPSCPENWMHGSGKASSYFIGIEPGKGMWFDFTMNQNKEYDYAVVISVQGINPLTGQKITELRLEQYKTQCPLHEVDFEQDRFCPKCKFKWPAQSYISTTTGETLWLDGFRNEAGEVRQYIITEEDVNRGIAQQMIGEDRVWAIGFAFYRSKEKRPAPPSIARRGMFKAASFGFGAESLSFNSYECDAGPGGEYLGESAPSELARSITSRRSSKKTKKLEVGAGARINQEIGVDPKDIDFWEPEPIGLIYVNYVTPEKVEEILEGGKREETREGFLNGVMVGN